MNKSEFVDAIAKKASVSKKDAKAMVDAFGEVVIETLKKGEKISLLGFGTFEVRERAARKGRNPQTGAVVDIPASKSAVLKFSSSIKSVLNK